MTRTMANHIKDWGETHQGLQGMIAGIRAMASKLHDRTGPCKDKVRTGTGPGQDRTKFKS